jgi:tricorn protease
VLYVSNHDEGRNALWKSVIEPFEDKKTEKIAGTEGLNISRVREVADKYFLLANGNLHKLNLDGNKIELINMTYKFRRNLSEEFHQMFYEVWAQMEQNYYDDKFHGLDWNKTKMICWVN